MKNDPWHRAKLAPQSLSTVLDAARNSEATGRRQVKTDDGKASRVAAKARASRRR